MKSLKLAASAAAVILAVGAVPITSFITNPERIQNITAAADVFGVFEYENYGSYIEITKYTGSATEVEIPDNIDGIPVTGITNSNSGLNGAFASKEITSVTIPDSIVKIGALAFLNCRSLASIELSDNITEIGRGAFSNCDSLTSVVIPDSVETLGESAFSSCDNLNTVTVGAKSIGAKAFYNTPKLTSVTITDNVYSIGEAAFSGCTSLETIVFPDSVKEMGGGMFYSCSSLKKVTLPNEITSLDYSNGGFFGSCTSLKEIVIPYYVTSIGNYCFDDVPLESLTIGARLTDFTNLPLDCETLKEINVVDENRNYSSVDGVLFNKDQTELVRYPKAKNDEEYTVPKTVAAVTKNAFNGNSSIKKVTLPENVTNISGSAFYKCAKLEDIIFMNPKCEIYADSYTIDNNTYINGYTGSTAEAYANKYNRNFVSMGSAPSETTTAVTTTSSETTTTTTTAETTTSAVTTTPDVLYGDINEDGTVDASDASLILAYYAYVQTGGKDGLKEFRDSQKEFNNWNTVYESIIKDIDANDYEYAFIKFDSEDAPLLVVANDDSGMIYGYNNDKAELMLNLLPGEKVKQYNKGSNLFVVSGDVEIEDNPTSEIAYKGYFKYYTYNNGKLNLSDEVTRTSIKQAGTDDHLEGTNLHNQDTWEYLENKYGSMSELIYYTMDDILIHIKNNN